MMQLIWAAAAALAITTPAPAMPPNSMPGVCQGVTDPVIDVHVHSYGQDDPQWGRRVPNPATGEPNTAFDGESHRRQTLEQMKRLGVVRAIVNGYDHPSEQAMIAADSDRIRRGYQVGVPSDGDLATMRRLHAEGRLTMIGEVVPQYDGVSPNDSRLEPLWALAEELQVPVGYHIGRGPPEAYLRGHPKHLAAIGDPLLMEPVLIRHPRLRIFLMHAGFPFSDNIEALLGEYPQVYVDLGAIHWAENRPAFDRFLRRLIEGGFEKRIMFGSDQMVWPTAIGQSLAAYKEADYLTRGQRRDILFNNAVRFFGWSDLSVCGSPPAP